MVDVMPLSQFEFIWREVTGVSIVDNTLKGLGGSVFTTVLLKKLSLLELFEE